MSFIHLLIRPALLASVLVAVTHSATAAPGEGWKALFNGENLEGWVNVNCAPDTFSVREGIIISTGIPTGVIRTDRQYENFELELEYRHMVPGGNAGLFVWSDALTAPGVPFTRSIEVQILDGHNSENATSHGDIFSIHGARLVPDRPHPGGWMRCLPSERRAKPSGQWNHYRLTCNDGRIQLAVNGKIVSGASECLPRKGYICLESEGSECHFRNIRIRELPSTDPTPEETATLANGFQTFYTGVDLSGWVAPANHGGEWEPNDWILRYRGQEAEGPPEPLLLRTDEEYGDFVLICDWRWRTHGSTRPAQASGGQSGRLAGLEVSDAAADSGIYLRGDRKSEISIGDSPAGSGEVQSYRTDPTLPADVRLSVTPRVRADKPIGQWNRFVITLEDQRLSVELNGQTVIEEAFLPGVPIQGPIALEGGRAPIDFANLYLKRLED